MGDRETTGGWRSLSALRLQLERLGYRIVPAEPTNEMMDAGLYQASHDAEYAHVWQSYVDMVRVGTVDCWSSIEEAVNVE